MARMSGISTNVEAKRKQHSAERKNLRKWQLVNGGKAFVTRELAMAWLKAQPGEKDPFQAPSPGQWLAYTFEYDP